MSSRLLGSIYRMTAGREAIAGWCVDQLDAWPVAHERRMVAAHGAPTRVVIAGAGGQTVVVVPGNGWIEGTARRTRRWQQPYPIPFLLG